MTLPLVFRGMLRRDLAPAAIGAGVLAAVVAGAALGWLAPRFTAEPYGTAALVAQGDRTLAAALTMVAIFRVIGRLAEDENTAWQQQLTAAGCARGTCLLAIILSGTVAALICYIAGAWTFAGVSGIVGGSYEPVVRSVITLPLVALMIFGAASFGGLMYGVAGAGGGRALAIVVLAFPWIVLRAVVLASPDDIPVTLLRFSSLPAPAFVVAPTLADTGRVVIYTGIVLAFGLSCAERRLARL